MSTSSAARFAIQQRQAISTLRQAIQLHQQQPSPALEAACSCLLPIARRRPAGRPMGHRSTAAAAVPPLPFALVGRHCLPVATACAMPCCWWCSCCWGWSCCAETREANEDAQCGQGHSGAAARLQMNRWGAM